MIKRLDHVCLIVRDLDRSIRFYRDTMGLKVSRVIDIEGEYPEKVLGVKGVKISYAKLSVPGKSAGNRLVLELHCWRKPRILPNKSFAHISFGVKDIDAEYRRLRRKGVRFISKPLTAPDGHARICFGYDPNGNRIEFIEIACLAARPLASARPPAFSRRGGLAMTKKRCGLAMTIKRRL